MKTLLLAVLALLATPVLAQYPKHDALNAMRYKSASIQAHRYREVQAICNRIQRDWSRYGYVSARSGVPPWVIAGLHNMEASGSFNKHLHEGSPLRWRTRWIPKGRPKTGTPPFTWEYSAEDALKYDRMSEKNWKRLGSALSACEGYNGWGYKKYHPETPTPYLWAGTSIEKAGKYTGDNRWSSTARSSQIGIAAIWKELARRGLVQLPSIK